MRQMNRLVRRVLPHAQYKCGCWRDIRTIYHQVPAVAQETPQWQTQKGNSRRYMSTEEGNQDAPAPEEPTETKDTPSDGGRPNEDDLASMYGYHEALVHYWRHEGTLKWEWINRLTGNHQLVSIVNRFSVMATACPELFEGLQDKFKEKIPDMERPLLANLAFAYGAQEAGDKEFWDKLCQRVIESKSELEPYEAKNIEKALHHIGRSSEASQLTR